MSPIFSLFDLIILACISQGLITSLLLFKSKQAKISKRLLAATLILLCIVSFRIVFHNVGWSNILEIRFLPLAWELFIPPLFYLYVASLTQENYKWRKLYLLHLIPGVLYLASDLNIYFQTLSANSIEQQEHIASSFYYHQTNEIEDYLIIISSFIYVFFSTSLIINFRKRTKTLKLKPAENLFGWLRTIYILMGLVALFLLINEIIDYNSQEMAKGLNHWRTLNLYLAATIYYIGFKGYRLETGSIQTSKKRIESISAKLDNKNIQNVEQQLINQLEQEQVYLDPEITLSALAVLTNTSAETLSFVINQIFNQNFRDLINSYRVKHVKSKLKEYKEGESILNIALESGFNSQASFYRAFNKFESMTPKTYLATQINKL